MEKMLDIFVQVFMVLFDREDIVEKMKGKKKRNIKMEEKRKKGEKKRGNKKKK